MLTKASRFFTSSLERGFFAWGLTVARHPFPVSITRITIHHCHHQHPRHHHHHHHHTPRYHQQHQQHHVPSGDSWLPRPICHLKSWLTQPQSGTSGWYYDDHDDQASSYDKKYDDYDNVDDDVDNNEK